MIRKGLMAVGAVVVPIVSFDFLTRRASRRLLDRPRVFADEASLGPALDALGGEVVRVRARDGLRLSARWVAASPLCNVTKRWWGKRARRLASSCGVSPISGTRNRT